MPQVELVFLGEVHGRSRGQGVSEVSFSPFFQVFQYQLLLEYDLGSQQSVTPAAPIDFSE